LDSAIERRLASNRVGSRKINHGLRIMTLPSRRSIHPSHGALRERLSCHEKRARTDIRSAPKKTSSRAPLSDPCYSTVTDLARFRGWSTFAPRLTAT
jgi:hypothetical protein